MNNDFIPGLIELKDEEFQNISKLVYKLYGINLTEKKKALVKGRLQKIIRSHGFKTYKEYYDFIIEDKSGRSILELIDRISTNHTYFFRENDHFDFLVNTILPDIKKKEINDIRIWSAGCSSGEEPYSIAITLINFFNININKYKTGILGTDVSSTALEKAVKGVFNKDAVRLFKENDIPKYFKPYDQNNYIIKDHIKNMILFKRFNLMSDTFPFKNKFHIIFCRNVMIYFDAQTKLKLINKFYDFLEDGGYLLIGHSEVIEKGKSKFKYIKPATYKKQEDINN